MADYDVVVIGGGPAGLAAAIEAKKNGASVVLIEREARLGGILKQCIHDGFGLVRFNEKLSGPEYAECFIDEARQLGIPARTLSFVTSAIKTDDGFDLVVVSCRGLENISCRKLILATGCRERTSKQVFIHGTRPYGVLTAGTCQNLVNIQGIRPAKRCVILGSGDIGLIMARRLTLEGAEVLGVFEAKSTPSGLSRNIQQCLNDFGIPLHLSTTVTRVYGQERLEAVEITDVDSSMRPIKGTERVVECDTLVLSVGLIPENELAQSLGVSLDSRAKGAVCDTCFETDVFGVYTCGNATHVNDLVDYVSESAEIAGRSAALSKTLQDDRKLIRMDVRGSLLYVVPQMIDVNLFRDENQHKVIFFFRSAGEFENAVVSLLADGRLLYKKKYSHLRPPEMKRFEVNLSMLDENSKVELVLEEEQEQK